MPTLLPPQPEMDELHQTLNELRSEHRDLDQVIDHLAQFPPKDQLLMRRLKKRRLVLKDRIDQVERQLNPDILA